MGIDTEIKLAINEVKIAENRFNNATKENVDFAIIQLLEAEEKLNQLILIKKNVVKNE